MKNRSLILLTSGFLILLTFLSCSLKGIKEVSILETTDIHGVMLPYDFIEKHDLQASLANSYSCFKAIRKEKDALFLLDDGDNLQGQPEVYYYNFIDTVSPHFLAEAMNMTGYDACTAGNHDFEAGHKVYDRLSKIYNFPLLAANAVNKKTGEPYFKPYTIIDKEGIRVAVLGLVTPAIPTWLPEELYSGIEFRDMVETAQKWMPEIKDLKPDLVVGLFHSGWNSDNKSLNVSAGMNENGSAAVAYNVPGFDIIFCGHDHRLANEKFVNARGDTVLILNGGSRSENIAEADISISRKGLFGKKHNRISGKLIEVKNFPPDPEFMVKFKKQEQNVKTYVDKVIGTSSGTFSSRMAYFGSSAFVDMIHSVQMEITGADVSFAAPLSFDVKISKGPVTVGDMFKLYRFENLLYTMELSGEEILKYLEYSYSGWLNTMTGPGDFLLKFRMGKDGKPLLTDGRAWLKNPAYDFDSAAGIDYLVDVSRPEGKRVIIRSFSDGRPFDLKTKYKVAVNSHRGNGGGGHFTQGAGISKDELRSRLRSSTDKDLRYYIMKSIESRKVITPAPFENWEIIPGKWVKGAAPREYVLLFGSEYSTEFADLQKIKYQGR
jgi:2',3'-cyclic-nucleotide 2'-phosphodiesterase/3'-nucleotidase